MKLEKIHTVCLAQGAYFISSNGESVFIDPLREIEPYIKRTYEVIMYPAHGAESSC